VAEFVFTAEQNDLRTAVRELLAKACDETAVRRAMEAGYDRALWARLGGELGVLGLAVSEDLGGAGGTLVDQAIVMEECGAAPWGWLSRRSPRWVRTSARTPAGGARRRSSKGQGSASRQAL
jgi:alkylation response protein AidB-like acyl-CoA dehydrogenase